MSDASPAQALLPSLFPDNMPEMESAEGYEGNRLAEMIFSAKTAIQGSNPVDSSGVVGHPQSQHENQDAIIPNENPGPRNFQPFFIVIEDATTGEHHHPYVHYVFSDDDPDLITNALLHNLDPHGHGQHNEEDDHVDDKDSRDHQTMNDPQDLQTCNDRCIILDIDPDGQRVLSAKSLCDDWQISSTRVTGAPTFTNTTGVEGADLMVWVEGVERIPAIEKLTPEELLEEANKATEQDMLRAMGNLAEKFQQEFEILQRLSKDYDTELAAVSITQG